ncbi:hypothetical protein [Reinekea blandensis]|uniref:Uncharacterized protein n=1 Tax=Reinekea blandensis MED297 TaxID=314283 RepID=A4BIC1_9GAMM|nr:hypothetical protein [Reinekea blandensis]EAR08128.1 hypothetical protein MED297_00530 [Reinekea sp. MED297] [Reinekea blandensis MED297]
MTTLTASSNTLTVSVRISAPNWLIRMARNAQARRQHRTLQDLSPELQRDIGHYAAPEKQLKTTDWC